MKIEIGPWSVRSGKPRVRGALTDAGVVVDDGEDAVAALLHVRVGADAAEQGRHPESGPRLAARLSEMKRACKYRVPFH